MKEKLRGKKFLQDALKSRVKDASERQMDKCYDTKRQLSAGMQLHSWHLPIEKFSTESINVSWKVNRKIHVWINSCFLRTRICLSITITNVRRKVDFQEHYSPTFAKARNWIRLKKSRDFNLCREMHTSALTRYNLSEQSAQ